MAVGVGTEISGTADHPGGFVASILASEIDSLSLLVANGRSAYALKSLDERGGAQELVRQQYSGRYPFELLQNANDAAVEVPGPRQVLFEVTPTALLVANMGCGFGGPEVGALCSLGRTSKDPRKSVGYKGLGFKSVGEITDAAQVFSPPYCFGFDAGRVRQTVERVAGDLPEGQRLPVYAFPFPLETSDAGEDAAAVSRLLEQGFVTVVRLPLRPGVTAAGVRRQVTELLVPELLLFLDATDSFEVGVGGRRIWSRCLRRPREGHDIVTLEHDGGSREWLVFRRRLALPDASLVAELGHTWCHVTEVGVAVAVALDDFNLPFANSRRPLHVYFPLQDSAGVSLVVHADFVLDLDRRHVSTAPEAQRYNDWLGREMVQFLAAEVAPALASLFPDHAGLISALAPDSATQGIGQTVNTGYNQAMARARFIPCRDGSPRPAQECVLLPAEVPDPGLAADHSQGSLDAKIHPDRLILLGRGDDDGATQNLSTHMGIQSGPARGW